MATLEIVVEEDSSLKYVPDRDLSAAAPSLYTDVARHPRLQNKHVDPERIHSAVTTYLKTGPGIINDFTANILASELLKMPPRPRPVHPTPTQELIEQPLKKQPMISHLPFLHRFKRPLELVGIKF